MKRVYITSASRTAVGSLGRSLKNIPADLLGSSVISSAISKSNLRNRMKFAKKIIKKNNYIKIKFYEEKIDSNKTIDLINYLNKEKKNEIYFIMGADNLINFHKWYKWKSIMKRCNILVFDRQGYKAKSLKSLTFNGTDNKNLTFVKFNKVNISSSQLRKV